MSMGPAMLRDKTGLAAVLPTYEAWSFGQKHLELAGPMGPGPGKYATATSVGPGGLRYAPMRARAPPSLVHGPVGPYDTAYMSTNKGPHYGFGTKHREEQNKNPGPGEYSVPSPWRAKSSSWGPSPTMRATVLVPITWEGPHKDTRLPCSMKLPFQPMKSFSPTPAPHDYQPLASDVTANAHSFATTFGVRTSLPNMSWGPGPADFAPNTLGAATAVCKSGQWPHM